MRVGSQPATISISQLLGLGDVVRVQDPEIQQTEGESPRWMIRPYVDKLDENGNVARRQERIYLGRVSEMGKRDAIKRKNEVMATINRSQYVVQAQITFGLFLDHYQKEYVLKPQSLSASTQGKYLSHIKNHLRPAFAHLMLAEVNTKSIDAMLSEKARSGMAWATRMDLRNLLCGIFTQARKWGLWKDGNPALDATVGRRKDAREKRKLTVEQTRNLLDSLPEDVRQICEVALYCTLRISETLGLMWKHVDFDRGVLNIRQRFYRGDLDVLKTDGSLRDVAMGELADELGKRYPGDGHGDEFVFSVQTHVGDWKTPGISRDDRDINQHFLRPAAKALGLYYVGFGFHAFRREAVTEIARQSDAIQAMRTAGHSKMDTTLLYGLTDSKIQDRTVRRMQKRIRKVEPIRKRTA